MSKIDEYSNNYINYDYNNLKIRLKLLYNKTKNTNIKRVEAIENEIYDGRPEKERVAYEVRRIHNILINKNTKENDPSFGQTIGLLDELIRLLQEDNFEKNKKRIKELIVLIELANKMDIGFYSVVNDLYEKMLEEISNKKGVTKL
jgi:hypothetical protein